MISCSPQDQLYKHLTTLTHISIFSCIVFSCFYFVLGSIVAVCMLTCSLLHMATSSRLLYPTQVDPTHMRVPTSSGGMYFPSPHFASWHPHNGYIHQEHMNPRVFHSYRILCLVSPFCITRIAYRRDGRVVLVTRCRRRRRIRLYCFLLMWAISAIENNLRFN